MNKKIDELLNQIGDFQCAIDGEEVHTVGVLRMEESNIFFHTQMELEHYRKLDTLYAELQFWGNINGTEVTLMNVHFRNASSKYGNSTVSVAFDPYEIIIGRCYKDEPVAGKITASITALNGMFSCRPLDFIHDFSKEKPYLLKYSYPNKIETCDQYGHLSIYQTFSQGWSRDEIKYGIIPIIEYQFTSPIDIMDAVARIAAVRNLFSFFANGYLPLENVKFADEQSEASETTVLCDISMYLNHPEETPVRNDPFFIRTSDFEEDFPLIWQKWLEMYEGSVPIPTLFYEIICNRSTRVNRFLNLAQAIEVYSGQYRESEVADFVRKHEKTPENKTPLLHLKDRLEDVLTYFNDCLEMDESSIPKIAQGVANMRNFYTHYNIGRYVEPTYQEMFSATHILRFMLLAIVYKTLGLSTKTIVDVRKSVEFQLYYRDIDTILNYASKKPQNRA